MLDKMWWVNTTLYSCSLNLFSRYQNEIVIPLNKNVGIKINSYLIPNLDMGNFFIFGDLIALASTFIQS